MKNITNKMPQRNTDIDIDIQDPYWLTLIPEVEQHTQNVISNIISKMLANKTHVEISLVLSNDDFIQELNKNYRSKNTPTNVLSFPQTQEDELNMPAIMLGDIIIASGVIKRESSEQKKNIKDHYTHMLVHGCLHLLHYDHITDEQAEEMESLEIEILNGLGIKNPYAPQ